MSYIVSQEFYFALFVLCDRWNIFRILVKPFVNLSLNSSKRKTFMRNLADMLSLEVEGNMWSDINVLVFGMKINLLGDTLEVENVLKFSTFVF